MGVSKGPDRFLIRFLIEAAVNIMGTRAIIWVGVGVYILYADYMVTPMEVLVQHACPFGLQVKLDGPLAWTRILVQLPPETLLP